MKRVPKEQNPSVSEHLATLARADDPIVTVFAPNVAEHGQQFVITARFFEPRTIKPLKVETAYIRIRSHEGHGVWPAGICKGEADD